MIQVSCQDLMAHDIIITLVISFNEGREHSIIEEE